MVDQGPLVFGKYQLLELLARGGMAEVYKAKSHGVEGFEKVLVIKRILREHSSNPKFVEMFIHEAKLAVTLSHANIVQVFDLGRADDSYFIAMEYVAGYDLSTVLKRGRRFGRPFPRELAIFVAAEVAKGLDYAHRRRDAQQRPLHIVHRDISPHNVLISLEGEVKLTDFGIAKARTTVEPKTEAGVLKGKYAYMAPEQARGEPITPQTDLFALGTVLYEAISGKNPFYSESTYDTLKRVRTGWVRPLSEVVPGVPDDLADAVARAMAPLPEDRYESAGQMYQDLVQLLYTAGRRVGAPDVAAYMDSLQEVSERSRARRSEEIGIRATFEPREDTGRTPVAKPVRRSEGPSSSASDKKPGIGGPAGAELPTGVARPQAERRDVTLLAIRPVPGVPPSEGLRGQALRFGGRMLPSPTGSRVAVPGSVAILFGIDEPDGHDVEAAARCAVALRNAAGVRAPMAIHAGRVLVTLEGALIEDRRYERLLGETLAALAPTAPLETVLTPGAAVSARRGFETASLPTRSDVVQLGPQKAHADRLGRFIGRRDALRRLGEILAEASAGAQRVVSIGGEAGLGKSRLLHETQRRLRLGGHDVGMHVAELGPEGRDVPLSTCRIMLRVILGIDDVDSEDRVRSKIYRLRELGLSLADLAAIEAALGLSTGGGPLPAGSRSLRAAVARIANKLAEDRLTVFAFDGIENADDASMALLRRLMRDAGSARITLIVTHRPGHDHSFRDLPGHEEVLLGPFDDQDVARATAALVGADEVPMELLREITLKSGGNPLYVEEYVRALIDEGAVRIAGPGKVHYDPKAVAGRVPKTLRGIVASRLRRLGPKERHVLQIAASIGASFSPALLAHVRGEERAQVEVSLSVLEQRGIVRRVAEDEYQIVHDLVGEVLREGLTPEARAELHGAIANGLEQVFPDRLDDLAERLAGHFQHAGARDRAASYLERAAARLASEGALAGAFDHLVSALDLLEDAADHGRLLALHERAGALALRARLFARGADRVERGIEVAELAGRNDFLARLCLLRGQIASLGASHAESRVWLDQARQVARTLDDVDLLREVTVATAEAHARSGDFASAIGLLREALELARRAADGDAQLRCLFPLALAQANAGARDPALRSLDEAAALVAGRADKDRYPACRLHQTELAVRFHLADVRGAIEAGKKALELAQEHGFFDDVAWIGRGIGEAYLRVGDFREAFPYLRQAHDIAAERKLGRVQFSVLALLGVIDALRFNSLEGRQRIVEACAYASEHGHYSDLVQAAFLLAYVDHAQGRWTDAVGAFREVIRLAAEYGHLTYARVAEQALEDMAAGRPVRIR